tara:strand:+ start:4340 stop:5464 length:1125 start_codon:yes stop_codon:yes gene_type:complete
MSSPKVSVIEQDEDELNFKITDVNVSIANSIRRIILSEIPIVVFKTTPYDKNNVDIIKNTSRMNNELIKQRFSCIPIHINDLNFPKEDYIVEVNVTNDTDKMLYVTTENFKIKNIKTDTYMNTSESKKIFPPNNISGNYIDLINLRPNISDEIPGESINILAKFDIGTAKDDSAFNVVSTCCYSNTPDEIKINNEWNIKLKELDKEMDKQEIENFKKDWYNLDAKRIVIKDSFNFKIETVGQYDNLTIVFKSCEIMINKIQKLNDDLQSKENLINESNNNINNCYDIILENEDYTLGKVIEFMLYNNYYKHPIENPDGILTFCSFNKKHPHDSDSIIKVAFLTKKEKIDVIQLLSEVCNETINIYKNISLNFKN